MCLLLQPMFCTSLRGIPASVNHTLHYFNAIFFALRTLFGMWPSGSPDSTAATFSRTHEQSLLRSRLIGTTWLSMSVRLRVYIYFLLMYVLFRFDKYLCRDFGNYFTSNSLALYTLFGMCLCGLLDAVGAHFSWSASTADCKHDSSCPLDYLCL